MNCNPTPEITCGFVHPDSCVGITMSNPTNGITAINWGCFMPSGYLTSCWRQSEFNFYAGNQICVNTTAIAAIEEQLGYSGTLGLSGCTGFTPSNTTIEAEFQAIYTQLCTFQYDLDQPINTGAGGINLKCLADPCGIPIGTLGQLLQAIINSVCAEDGLVYEALLFQSGTTAPTSTILADTLDVTESFLTFSYISTGTYRLVASGPITLPTGHVSIFVGSQLQIGQQVIANLTAPNTITIHTASGGTLTDGILNNTSLLIKVFP